MFSFLLWFSFSLFTSSFVIMFNLLLEFIFHMDFHNFALWFSVSVFRLLFVWPLPKRELALTRSLWLSHSLVSSLGAHSLAPPSSDALFLFTFIVLLYFTHVAFSQ